MEYFEWLNSVPWPTALLVLVVFSFGVFIFYLYLPLLDEAERLKQIETEHIVEIKQSVCNLDTVYMDSINNLDIENKITNIISSFGSTVESRFDSLVSINNEIFQLTEKINTASNEFGDVVDQQLLKEIKEFNKGYFVSILEYLQKNQDINNKLISDIDKIEDNVKEIRRSIDNTKTESKRDMDLLKDKLNTVCNNLDSIKEKMYMLTTMTSRFRDN